MQKIEIETIYKTLLNRLPSDEEIAVCSAFSDVAEVREQIAKSIEFLNSTGRQFCSDYLNYSNSFDVGNVQLKVNSEQRGRLFELVEQKWDALGRDEPYWAVLSAESYKMENMGTEQKGKFYATTDSIVKGLFKLFERNGVTVDHLESVLDYGCGVGRVLCQFEKHFDQTHGADVSQSMLNLAAEQCHCASLHKISSMSDVNALPEVDMVFSRLTLQHSPPPIALEIMDSLMAKVRPGGVMLMQMLTCEDGYSFDADQYIEHFEPVKIENHCVPQRAILAAAKEHSLNVLEVSRDSSNSGNKRISHMFLLHNAEVGK